MTATYFSFAGMGNPLTSGLVMSVRKRRYPFIADIQATVAEHYGIREIEMRSARRSRDVARPRQVAMYLCRQLTLKSLPEIGRRFGGRDHTTVIHAVRTIETLRIADKILDADICRLVREMER